MKKYLSLLIVFGIMQNAIAQITIEQADMPIANDSTVRVAAGNTTGLNFATTGPNSIWDFSTITPLASTTDKYFAITNAPLFALLTFGPFASNANLRSQIFKDGQSPINLGGNALLNGFFNVDSTFEYYKKSASRYARTGYSIRLNGLDLPLPYDSNDIFYKLPLSFGNVDSNLSIFEINTQFLSFFYYRTRQKRVNRVDGWGKLKLPNGFEYDVLRIKSELFTNDSIRIDTFITQSFAFTRPKTIEYKWMAKGKQAPILEVIGTEIVGNFTPTTIRFLNVNAVGINNDALDQTVLMYPNPSNNFLYIDGQGKSIQTITLFDIFGKQCLQEQLTKIKHKINISSLCNGQYYCKIVLENGVVVTKKILKQ